MSIKATKDNAKFISKVYTQEASDTDWVKAKPKVKFKYKEANVLDSSTTSELVINKRISEGDIIVVNDNGIKKKILKGSDILQNENLVDNPDPFGDGSGVALYQLDGNAKDTGGRYDGRWEGNEQYDVGRFGQGAKTTKGNGNIILGKDIFKDGDKISVSLWVNFLENEDNYSATFAKYNYGNNSYKKRFIFGRYDGKLAIFNGDNYNWNTGSDLHLNKLYHLAFVVDANKTTVYLNGELNFIVNKTTEFENNLNVRLGYTDYNHYGSNQIIDQVRIFNRALTDEEVQKLYTEEASKFNVSDLNLSQTPSKIWLIDGSIITPKGGSTRTQLVFPANSVKAFDALIVNDGAEKEIVVRSVERDSDGNDVVQIGQELALVPSEVAKVDVPEVIVDVEPTEQELLADDIELEKESSTKTQFVGVLTKNIPISSGMEVILDNKAVVTNNVNIENMSIVDKVDPFGDNSGVALWQLDGNANDVGENYNGSWEGNEQYDTGRFGQAGKFDGNSYITLSNSISISSKVYTISFWAKNIKEPSDGYAVGVINKSSNNYTNVPFWYNDKIYFGGTSDSSIEQSILPSNEFYHLVATYNNGNIVVYLNGSIILTLTTSSNNYDHLSLLMNRPYDGENHMLSGIVDQVRIFNRALTDEEVQTLYKYELKHKYILEFPEQPQAPQTCLVPAKGKRVKLTPLQMSYDESSNTLLKEAQELEKTGRALQYAIKSPKDVEIDQLNIDLWKRQ